jgi:3D (Asp-Asp-Asp) domain-containing protein
MRRILSRSSTRKLVVTCVAVGALIFAYEATTFDLLPWGGQSGAVDPAAPVPGARLQFTATAYCKGTTTASGAEVRTGIAAADDDILPVGSVVNVTTENAKYNGVYTIMDTGPAVQGRLIDLYMWSCHEALAFGRKPIQVIVLRLGWNPRASTPEPHRSAVPTWRTRGGCGAGDRRARDDG